MIENNTEVCGDSKCLRILVVGGCHIDRRAVGLAQSFVDVMVDTLRVNGYTVLLETVPDAKASHRQRIVRKYRAFGPDFVIMQLGHAETLRSQSGRLFTLLRLEPSTFRPILRRRPLAMRTVDAFVGSPAWMVKQCLKVVLDFATDHRRGDVAAFLAARSRLAQYTAKDGPDDRLPFVIWMSPFPCADWVVCKYRKEISVKLAVEVLAANERYFNVFELADRLGWRQRKPYMDSIHIDESAHWDIGYELAGTCALMLAMETVRFGKNRGGGE